MSLSTRYSPKETEAKWYAHWEAKNYFHSEPDEREPFTIVIPPPNVTGILHMGHMLNNTIQDILIRRARLQGKNACWVPGTDHASIATEAKVVKLLRKQGIKKSDLTREEFLAHAFAWKDKYGGIILDQLKRLGASCDWQRTRFTMEEKLSKAVIKVFVDLHKKGKIYRGLRMTNWDPVAQTALSNEEVLHSDETVPLFHIRYERADAPGEYLTVATTRPETIMADVAIAVHPDDGRYKNLVGKKVLVPLINRPIPIIADSYVDMEFGTAALKITPAHDQNDYDIGQRHGLPVIDILNADGTLNEKAQILVGEDRFEARKKIKTLLKESGNLVEIENYKTKIGRSERTDAVIEPRLTLQWYVHMDGFAKTALKAVKSGEVTFHPGSMWNMYYQWLNPGNVRDWCISRQLWWGQQIPAWYLKTVDSPPRSLGGGRQTARPETSGVDGDELVFVGETAEEALAEAKKKTGNNSLTINDLKRDEDVLDTWFSSWLWPISVFDGFDTQEELKYYYPTNVLVTGWDIMFFWVARMIMAGYEWSEELLGKDLKGKQPFNDVYFTGMVRDNKRRKMSKSLGNSPDALQLIENYGADGVRFGMLSCASAGNDIIFDAPFDKETNKALNESKLCEQGRNFCNKMWNALRLIKGWETSDTAQPKINALAVKWIKDKTDLVMAEVEKNFGQFRLSDALMNQYQLIWGDFCSWYLEIIKPKYLGGGKSEPLDKKTREATIEVFEKLMVALHPFMPFVTEEIWHQLRNRKDGNDCIIQRYPAAGRVDKKMVESIERAKDAVSRIREARSSKGISPNEALNLFVEKTPSSEALFAMDGIKDILMKLGNLSALEITSTAPDNAVSFLSGTEKYFLEVNIEIDAAAELERLEGEKKRVEGFIAGVKKKLGNERFVNNAPAAVVEKEKKKLADGEEKLRLILESIKGLWVMKKEQKSPTLQPKKK
ncbi:MAG TPA: valine--tRNA ligase [Bacteroidetes bacterium]|nr:valine--tRNA ligase [Bacteroidota bacterium]